MVDETNIGTLVDNADVVKGELERAKDLLVELK